jgi:hypothetical protein
MEMKMKTTIGSMLFFLVLVAAVKAQFSAHADGELLCKLIPYIADRIDESLSQAFYKADRYKCHEAE